jgi:hypothetical protein
MRRDAHTMGLCAAAPLSFAEVAYLSPPWIIFFIDFVLSTRFDSREERSLVTGKLGQNKTVPELSDTVPYDSFKVDIYQMGGVIQELVEVRMIQL